MKGTAAKPPVRLSHFARPGRFERRQTPPLRAPVSKSSETYREERVQKVRRRGRAIALRRAPSRLRASAALLEARQRKGAASGTGTG